MMLADTDTADVDTDVGDSAMSETDPQRQAIGKYMRIS